jgi:hypothetical protein
MKGENKPFLLWTKLLLYITWFVNAVFPSLSNCVISFTSYLILASRETLVINIVPFPLYVVVTTFK